MVNHHRINVSRNGRHFFATEVRDEADALDVFVTLKARFPEIDGWKISVTKWEAHGTNVDWSSK